MPEPCSLHLSTNDPAIKLDDMTVIRVGSPTLGADFSWAKFMYLSETLIHHFFKERPIYFIFAEPHTLDELSMSIVLIFLYLKTFPHMTFAIVWSDSIYSNNTQIMDPDIDRSTRRRWIKSFYNRLKECPRPTCSARSETL